MSKLYSETPSFILILASCYYTIPTISDDVKVYLTHNGKLHVHGSACMVKRDWNILGTINKKSKRSSRHGKSVYMFNYSQCS